MFLIYKNEETATSYIQHKRFVPNDTHPNCLRQLLFIVKPLVVYCGQKEKAKRRCIEHPFKDYDGLSIY
jgi:hypothetical protein